MVGGHHVAHDGEPQAGAAELARASLVDAVEALEDPILFRRGDALASVDHVVTFSADIGQTDSLENVEANAMKTGAIKVYVDDLKETFVKDYVFPAFRANVIYEGQYLMGTSIARPLIAKRQMEIKIKIRMKIKIGTGDGELRRSRESVCIKWTGPASSASSGPDQHQAHD